MAEKKFRMKFEYIIEYFVQRAKHTNRKAKGID